MHTRQITDEELLAAAGLSDLEMERATEALRSPDADLAALAGLSSDELNAVYARAHQLTRDGAHGEAMLVLSTLAMLRPGESRYFRGLGLACQRADKPVQAAMAYALALKLAPDDIISEILRAECQLQVRCEDEGRRTLEAALVRGSPEPTAAPYLRRAKLLLAALRCTDGAEPEHATHG